MTIVAENQVKLNCFPSQFRPKTVPGKKLKRNFKRLLDASEDNSCESTVNILDFGSFERNVPLKESMLAKSKKRRLEISGPGDKKHNDLWKATLPVRLGTPASIEVPMTVVAENQGKLNCFPLQFWHMSSEAKTVPRKNEHGVISETDSIRQSTPASIEAPMSLKKALRAAMLKKCFAEMIFKATHRVSVLPDRLRLQQERERLQQERREENAKLEALLKAAEEAFRREQQHDLMMQRENERKAARILIDKVEKSVEVDDNMVLLNNLKMIGCEYLYYPLDHGYRLDVVFVLDF